MRRYKYYLYFTIIILISACNSADEKGVLDIPYLLHSAEVQEKCNEQNAELQDVIAERGKKPIEVKWEKMVSKWHAFYSHQVWNIINNELDTKQMKKALEDLPLALKGKQSEYFPNVTADKDTLLGLFHQENNSKAVQMSRLYRMNIMHRDLMRKSLEMVGTSCFCFMEIGMHTASVEKNEKNWRWKVALLTYNGWAKTHKDSVNIHFPDTVKVIREYDNITLVEITTPPGEKTILPYHYYHPILQREIRDTIKLYERK